MANSGFGRRDESFTMLEMLLCASVLFLLPSMLTAFASLLSKEIKSSWAMSHLPLFYHRHLSLSLSFMDTLSRIWLCIH